MWLINYDNEGYGIGKVVWMKNMSELNISPTFNIVNTQQ